MVDLDLSCAGLVELLHVLNETEAVELLVSGEEGLALFVER